MGRAALAPNIASRHDAPTREHFALQRCQSVPWHESRRPELPTRQSGESIPFSEGVHASTIAGRHLHVAGQPRLGEIRDRDAETPPSTHLPTTISLLPQTVTASRVRAVARRERDYFEQKRFSNMSSQTRVIP